MILGQNQHGKDVVISFAGRGPNSAEKNYSVTEREALSVVEAVKYFQTYLYGKRFVVYTDHHALQWLLRLKDPTGRLARWSLLLQQYDFEIKHRPGIANGNADALSRRRYDPSLAALRTPCVQTDRGYQLQRRDPSLAALVTYLEDGILPSNDQSARSILHSAGDFYLDKDCIL